MYKNFARVYDALMTNTPYDEWATYIDKAIFENFKTVSASDARRHCFAREDILVLDLACGTGNIALRLAKAGYDLIGADASEDMLAEAARKAYDENLQILFLTQDMRELNLYGTIDAAVCVCDGISYILNEEDLMRTFERVKLFLNPSGIFIFDMNTESRFEKMQNKIFEGDGDGETYEWHNNYDAKTKINECRVVFFSPGEEPFEETHKQRAYSPETVQKLLAEAGFSSVDFYDGYTKKTLSSAGERAVFIARNAACLL
ncbi:MAG: class I SAM-dependent methyltransferase [Defluviitaleaceae bacterium]|nr:class I SAM-dependent methyltransferase [Defluviitaleaceae bacterium]